MSFYGQNDRKHKKKMKEKSRDDSSRGTALISKTIINLKKKKRSNQIGIFHVSHEMNSCSIAAFASSIRTMRQKQKEEMPTATMAGHVWAIVRTQIIYNDYYVWV